MSCSELVEYSARDSPIYMCHPSIDQLLQDEYQIKLGHFNYCQQLPENPYRIDKIYKLDFAAINCNQTTRVTNRCTSTLSSTIISLSKHTLRLPKPTFLMSVWSLNRRTNWEGFMIRKNWSGVKFSRQGNTRVAFYIYIAKLNIFEVKRTQNVLTYERSSCCLQ